MWHKSSVVKDPTISISQAKVLATIRAMELLRNSEDLALGHDQTSAWSVKVRAGPDFNAA